MNGTSGFQGFEFIWKRPREPPPRLWSIFQGRRRLDDGTLPNFIVQEMPEEMIEEVLDHLMRHCYTEEIISAHVGLSKDPSAMSELRSFLKGCVLQGISVVTLLANNGPTTLKPRLVAVNVLNVLTRRDDIAIANYFEKFRSETLKNTMTVGLDFTRQVNVFEIFGVDEYLGSYGLSVQPSFRGFGLGESMLKARDLIGRAYAIPVTATLFVGPDSQVVANRTGFQILIEKRYNELKDRHGNIAHPNIAAEFIRYMAKRLY